MTREPIEQVVVQTTDFEETVATMRSAFGDVELRQGDDGRSEFGMHSVRTGRLWTCRWSMAGVCGGTRDETDAEAMFLTGVRLGGGARLWAGRTEMDADRPFVYPDRLGSTLDRPTFANLAVSRAVVIDHARALTGLDDLELRFTGTAPVERSLDRVWSETIASAARRMDSLADRIDADVAQAGLVGMVAALLLRTFPNTALEATGRIGGVGPVTPTRRATIYIDDHLADPISVPDIARAARLSTRGLYAAFRRDLDTTPMDYLRAGRLAAARRELQDGDPDSVEIDAIALRWGWAQTARFAEAYRAEFGEQPIATLLR